MKLTLEQYEELKEKVYDLANWTDMSDWETRFVDDMTRKFDSWQENVKVSEKQRQVIDRIYEKHFEKDQ